MYPRNANTLANVVWTVSAGGIAGLINHFTGWGLLLCLLVGIPLGAVIMVAFSLAISTNIETPDKMASVLREVSTPHDAREAVKKAAKFTGDSGYRSMAESYSDEKIVSLSHQMAKMFESNNVK